MEKKNNQQYSKIEEMGWMFAGLSSVFVVAVCVQQLM